MYVLKQNRDVIRFWFAPNAWFASGSRVSQKSRQRLDARFASDSKILQRPHRLDCACLFAIYSHIPTSYSSHVEHLPSPAPLPIPRPSRRVRRWRPAVFSCSSFVDCCCQPDQQTVDASFMAPHQRRASGTSCWQLADSCVDLQQHDQYILYIRRDA